MASQTVRIRPETHIKLKQLAEAAGQPLPDVLDKAIEAYRRQQILEQTNQAFAALRANPQTWQDELAERATWEQTLGDGLKDD